MRKKRRRRRRREAEGNDDPKGATMRRVWQMMTKSKFVQLIDLFFRV